LFDGLFGGIIGAVLAFAAAAWVLNRQTKSDRAMAAEARQLSSTSLIINRLFEMGDQYPEFAIGNWRPAVDAIRAEKLKVQQLMLQAALVDPELSEDIGVYGESLPDISQEFLDSLSGMSEEEQYQNVGSAMMGDWRTKGMTIGRIMQREMQRRVKSGDIVSPDITPESEPLPSWAGVKAFFRSKVRGFFSRS
jgi:hypothetical protein